MFQEKDFCVISFQFNDMFLINISSADFMIEVRGDSMQPKFSDGDRVLVKSSESIYEGEIGVFILNNESYIKNGQKCQIE